MTRFEARRITKKGYRFALTGTLLGIFLSYNSGLHMTLICAYSFWALFHGVQIIMPVMRYLYDFGPVHLRTTTISMLFWQSIRLKILRAVITVIAGYLIGIFGGAILRQLYLWIISMR